jgi:hypothetical protein
VDVYVYVKMNVNVNVNLDMAMDMDCDPTVWKGEDELEEFKDDDEARVINARLQCFPRQYCRDRSGGGYSEENTNGWNLTRE